MENTENSSAPESTAGAGGAKEKVEKQARQLAYDVRYKTKQAMAAKSGGKLDPAAVRKQYMSQLGKSPANPAVKARAKAMLVGEDYINVNDLVLDATKDVLHKVFVEGIKEEPKEEEVISEGDDKTYKIRVTDKETGNSYVRMASRAKIGELRNNPNISSVEMTGYGEPTRSVAAEKGGKKKAKKDYDGDGKVESSTAEYKGSKDKAIKKSLASENFDGFLELVEKKSKSDKITGEGVNNKKLIKVFPDDGVKEQVEPETKEDPQIAQKQKRIGLAKKQILQKKIQAVRSGAGADITASHEPEGEVIDEAQSSYDKARKAAARRAANRNAERRAGTRGGNMERETYTSEAGARMHYKGYRARENEEVEVKGGVIEEGEINRADISGGTKAAKNAAAGKGKYTPGVGVTKDFKLDPKFKAEEVEKEVKKEEEKEEDYRGMKTKVELVRNKLRAMGLKMSQELEGEEFINESVDHATEYFFNEGINEDGLELIIEEVGIEDFTEFVLDLPQQLDEERSAERAKPRDYAKVKASVYKKDAKRKAEGKGEYSKSAASKRNYGDEVAPEGKPEKKAATKKKVVASVAKAKTTQSSAKPSKKGLGDRIRGAVKAGVKRHKAARAAGRVPEKRAKEFGKGVVSGVKTAVKAAKDVKRVVTGESTFTQLQDPELLDLISSITTGDK